MMRLTVCVITLTPLSVHYMKPPTIWGNGFGCIISLRVVDASSMPILPNGHPMATIIMLAHRAVDFIVNDEDAL